MNVKHIVEGVVKVHAVAMILSVGAFSSKSYRKLQARHYTVMTFLVVDSTVRRSLLSKNVDKNGCKSILHNGESSLPSFP